MSNELNLCQFIGHAGKAAEVRYTSSGDAVASFSLAVGWKTKEKDGTEWVRCTAFGKLAEICGQYVTKGKQVYVSGKFRTRKYQDKDGHEKWATEINIDQLQLLGGRSDGESAAPAPARRQAATQAPAQKASTGTGFDDMSDDVPW